MSDEGVMNPKISIIVPVYKVEKYFSRCVDSILGQSYKNIELILVDDGSPDNCPLMCDDYAKKDSRIKVIHKTNAGVSAARNIGIENASGEYIGFVDSDDFIEPQMFEKLVSAMDYNGEKQDVSICNINRFVDGKKIPVKYEIPDGTYLSEKLRWYLFEPRGLDGFVFIKLFRKSIIDEFNIRFANDIYYMEDTLFTHRYLLNCKNGYICSDNLYNYFINTESVTNAKKIPEGTLSVFERLYELEPDEQIKKSIFLRKETFIVIQLAKFKTIDGYKLSDAFPDKNEQQKAIRDFVADKRQKIAKRVYYIGQIYFSKLFSLVRKVRGIK